MYSLKGTIGKTPTFEGETEVLNTTGGFTLPIMGGMVLLARRSLADPKGNPIPYPGWWNCLGGGASQDDLSVDAVIGREFTEESMCDLGEIKGRAGRAMSVISRRPTAIGQPISVDTAEAWVVAFKGEPKLTDESREFRWFSFSNVSDEPEIVGKDIRPFGRTMLFVLWGVSIAQDPLYRGPATEALHEKLRDRLVPSPNYRLMCDDRFLVRVQLSPSGERVVEVWHNLSLAPEADRNGILPGGPL
jgi:hypothetical protein